MNLLHRSHIWGGIRLRLLTFVVGQKITLPIFVGVYLWRWGGYSWRIAIGYAIGAWAFIVGFYDQIMNLLFHPSWLYGLLQPRLPDWLPSWLVI